MTTETAATLLERELELRELADALTDAEERRGRVVLVEAPAGLGKTSVLWAASAAAAEAGFACRRARASDLERDFAYGCVRQLLEPVVAKVSAPERERLFEGAAGLSRGLFAPSGDTPSGSPSATPAADSAFSMLHGLYWLLNNLADEGPLVLCVDDLHWSDTESLRFLNYLAPRLDGLPVAVLATTRPGEEDSEDLARLAAAPETTVLRLRPLSAEATATLCRQSLGSEVAPEFAEACREVTGGNPFFLEALLREAAEQGVSTDSRAAVGVRGIGPAAVAQAVLLRLAGRPAAATALVRAAAVLGNGASVAEAAGLADLSEQEAARSADVLAGLAILKPAEGLEFAHPIVREAVYSDIGSRERAEAHGRAARILAGSGASEERIAAQIVEAEPAADPERVELLRRVAVDALMRGAPAAAVAWLRRALAEPPPPEGELETLLELGSAELRLGAPEAVDHLAAAVEVIREPALLAMSVRQLALALSVTGSSDRAVEAVESAIDLIEPVDRELGLLLAAEAASHAQQASPEARAPAASRLERYGNLDGSTPGERLVLASVAFERARASESAGEAARHLEAALADGRLLGEQQLDLVGPFYDLVLGLLATDALDVADACLDQALAEARARASIPAVAYVTDRRGWVLLRRGAVAQAEADARTALELLTSHGIPLGIPFALALLIETLIESGEPEAAERELRSSGLGPEIPPTITGNFLLEARSRLHVALGREREGLEDMLEFGRRHELWGAANPLASRWRSRAALAIAAMGDAERARRMADEDLERARRWGAASGLGVALRATALVHGGLASIDRLREAGEVLERSPARLEHARALTDLGAALRRANRRTEARTALEEGLHLAERCNARALVDRARTELRAAGGRSSEPEGGVQQLTASEQRVAELAAQGHSNPEIAQALFVTRKTVETHLGHVYRKLDIRGRGKLVHALAEQTRAAGG
ncbi:MAG: AAA family ATPase [Thermoleophilaceae bacterium]